VNPPAAPRPLSLTPRGPVAVVAALLAGIAAFCVLLWPEWAHNPDLSHGFFAVVICAVLVFESRAAGPRRWLPPHPARSAATVLLLAGAIILLALTGLLAASVGWSHALVRFVLAAALCLYLGAGLVVLAGTETRLVPLNWISLTAVGLWLLAAPLPHGTYSRLTLTLQGWVTDGVLDSLQILGIPARQRGNVIELARTSVGVEEACSGIRSLLSCLYAGLFFAAWQVRSFAGRAALIILAPLLAVGLNFVRSLGLTLLANAGVDIAGFWHDVTGFAILGLTAALLGALAWWLAPPPPAAPTTEPAPAPAAPPAQPLPAPLSRLFWGGQALLAAVALFFFVQTRSDPVEGPPPDLAALLPASAPGWEVRTQEDLYRFSGVLRTEYLAERSYFKMQGDDVLQLTVYVAFWPPGQSSVSMVASHTPDACWPGTGWTPVSLDTRRVDLPLPTGSLAGAEHRRFLSSGRYPQDVWFWHVYDGRVIEHIPPYSVPALVRSALRYGFRRDGSQWFIRISSNQPWDRLEQEPLVQQIAANLAPVGL